MRRDIRTTDAALCVWTAIWIIAAALVFTSVRQLEDFGKTVATAARGLDETSQGLDRASAGLRDTGNALDVVPLVGESISDDIRTTADDVDRVAVTVRETARDARRNARDATSSARRLAVVLGLAVLLVPTLPIVALYLTLRPLIGQQLARR